MKNVIISLSLLVSVCALNASIGDVIGGAIDSSIGVVHDTAHSIRDRVHRDHPRFIPLSLPNSAFDQRYDAALEQIRELQSNDVSLEQKKQNINRIITLSNEMISSLAPELAADQVQDLKTYVNNETKRIKDLQITNNFNGAADVASALVDYLRSFE